MAELAGFYPQPGRHRRLRQWWLPLRRREPSRLAALPAFGHARLGRDGPGRGDAGGAGAGVRRCRNARRAAARLGPDIAPLDPAIRAALRERRVIVEAIATGSAVRTYNVLLAEDRAVGAALIAVENAK